MPFSLNSCRLFLTETPTPEIYTLSLHDALPICPVTAPRHPAPGVAEAPDARWRAAPDRDRSEEHTSELQSRENLVCRLLLEKKNSAVALHAVRLRHATRDIDLVQPVAFGRRAKR